MTTLVVAFFSSAQPRWRRGAPLFLVPAARAVPTRCAFTGGAALVGLLCAALEFGSERLVSQFTAAGGNPAYACVDLAATRFQTIAIGGYAVVAWLTALALWRR